MNEILIQADPSSLYKKTILIISNDLLLNDIISTNYGKEYKLYFFKEQNFSLLKNILYPFDLIVFDNSLKNIEDYIHACKSIQSFNLTTPLFVLENQMPENLSLYKYCNTYSIFVKNRNIEELFQSIDLCLYYLSANKKIYFNDGFSFDLTRELLLHNKKIIFLTKIEKRLIKLLAENINNITSYEIIEKKVWFDKKFSIYTLRNTVKKIREKTKMSFIQNLSNNGYYISSL